MPTAGDERIETRLSEIDAGGDGVFIVRGLESNVRNKTNASHWRSPAFCKWSNAMTQATLPTDAPATRAQSAPPTRRHVLDRRLQPRQIVEILETASMKEVLGRPSAGYQHCAARPS